MWSGSEILGQADLVVHPRSTTHMLCGLRQVTEPLWSLSLIWTLRIALLLLRVMMRIDDKTDVPGIVFLLRVPPRLR